MKKSFFLLSQFFLSLVLLAQDEKTTTTKSSYGTEKIVGIVILAGFVIWGLYRFSAKKKK